MPTTPRDSGQLTDSGRAAHRTVRAAALAAVLAAAPVALWPAAFPAPVLAQPKPLTPDDQAAILLNTGRRAYNDRSYAPAAAAFREFVQKFPAHADAPAAQYGLGLSLLDGPRDFPAAADAFTKAAAVAAFPDAPMAHYFAGVALRGVGNATSGTARGKPPPEADAIRATARQRYDESAARFGQAVTTLSEKLKSAPADEQPGLSEWVARARCDQAEALLRTGKFKEAADAANPVAADAAFVASKYKPLALYHVGHARFGLKEYTPAGKALSQLAPFNQEFGPHARYLLARVHHLSDERPEAAAQYKAAVAAFEASRNAAKQELQQGGDKLAGDRRAYLDGAATGPVPDYVSRAAFYQAVLLSDDGKFPEAKELFVKFAAESKDHPLAPEAQARAGFCQLQSRQYKEAADTLTPLKDHAQLGDRANWWLAKAQLAAADPANPAAAEATARSAAALMRVAADRAAANAGADPAAKARRADILVDLGDALVSAKQFRDAAGVYQAVVAENVVPERNEEAAQRLCTALNLAGAFNESDEACARFEQKYPQSTLMPAVWFRAAENAFAAASAVADKPDAPKPEVDRLFGVAVARYQKVVAKYPEFAQVNLARQGIGLSHYRSGKFEQAAAALGQIPDADRNGDLANVPYVQADALVRTFPPEADDAIAAAGLLTRAEQAAKLMESFAASNPKSPLAPDATLKCGYCYQRMAGLLADKPERDKAVQVAREQYEKHLQQFRDHPTGASVVFERAKLIAFAGDVGTAANELRRFAAPPLSTAPNAPLAMLRLSSLLRSQGQAKEAAELLARVRAEQEANLLREPARADWVPTLAYEHALAVKESGKPAEARPLFEAVAARFPDKPEGFSATWRAVQCRREEAAALVAGARQKLAQPGVKPDEATAALNVLRQQVAQAEQVRAPMGPLVARFGGKDASAEPHLRALYELAWCDRTTAEAEAEVARYAARTAARDKVVARQPKPAAGAPVPPAPPTALLPDVAASALPVTEGENRARERYGKLIAAGGDHPLAARAMFELAEMLADRGEHDPAIEWLNKALLTAPPQELAERVRLRLAACFLGKGDAKTALAAAKPVMDAVKPNAPPTPLSAEARFLSAEAMVQQKEWGKAIELLVPFRDAEPLRNVAGVSDRALLRLGQAYASAGQHDPARQAFEAVVQRYPQSTWADEARFGVGLAMQSKGQFDEAVGAYAEVTRRTAAEVAARAQVHIGLCRISQKRYPEATAALLGVPYAYDYPEWSAAACYEAARAFKEMQKPQEAAGLWRRVVDEFPATPSAPLAKARLSEVGG